MNKLYKMLLIILVLSNTILLAGCKSEPIPTREWDKDSKVNDIWYYFNDNDYEIIELDSGRFERYIGGKMTDGYYKDVSKLVDTINRYYKGKNGYENKDKDKSICIVFDAKYFDDAGQVFYRVYYEDDFSLNTLIRDLEVDSEKKVESAYKLADEAQIRFDCGVHKINSMTLEEKKQLLDKYSKTY